MMNRPRACAVMGLALVCGAAAGYLGVPGGLIAVAGFLVGLATFNWCFPE